MTELKPCPCCGPKAFIIPSTKCDPQAGKHCWTAELRCHECGLNISRSAATEKEALYEAIEAWNTRAEREVGISHTRPQYDCNGVLCKRGDIVFGLGREQHRYKVLSEELDVEKCEPYNHGRFTLPCLDLTEGDESVCFLDPRMVSHKEPGSYEELQEMLREESPKGDGDSYEKLRDDLKRKYGSNSQWVKRLTALIERGA